LKLIRIELRELVEIAKIQSTEASNRIEGISTADDRLKNLVQAKTTPRNRDESEIAGYRDVLNTIHENYDYIPINANYLLQLHRDLYKFLGNTEGGTFKTGDNIIREMDAEGNQHVRFMPVAAWETPDAIDELCNSFRDAKEIVDPLILDMMFILDFLCIHPFNDGNGRMSRLLTLLLLYQSGFIVGKYVSIEKIIEESKETYYEALQDSSINWHENKNDYKPFVNYMLGVIVSAYKEFETRVKLLTDPNISKADRIREMIKNHIGTITKSEVEVQSIFLNCGSRSIFRYAQSIKGCKIEKYERRCSFDTKRECHRGNEKKWWICYLSAIKSDC
jgi:Fic family protein